MRRLMDAAAPEGSAATTAGRLWAAAREALRSLALAAPALMFVLVYVGDEYRKPLRTTPVFLALGALALWLGRPRVPSAAPPPSPGGFWARGSDRWGLRVVAVASFVLLAVLLSRRPYQGMVLYHLRGTGLWTAVTIAAAGLALVLARPPRPWIVLGILIAGDLAVRAFSLRQWEIHPAVRDMLPLVMSAIDSFLAGENPYAVHTMQIGSQVPLTYPPAMWLAYLPARLAGIDIRWTSWLADAVVAVALAWPAVRASGFGLRASGRSDASSGPAVPNPGPTWPALLFAATYLFLPDTHWNGIYAEPNVDWAVVAVLACCLATGRPLAAGAALGVAIAMRPLNFALVPLLAAGLWRVHGLRTAARSILVAAAVSAVLYVPFVLRDPDAFFLGAVRWLIEYGPAHRTWFHGMLGFSGPLYEARLEAWMHPAQIAGIAIALGLTAWRARSARGVLAGCAAAYSVFVAFSPLVWMSFWIGAVILVSAAVGMPPARSAVGG
ncbi:MAG: hypothetical protein QME96_07885, partial [Myxococcota bacterium]|nr:hypothetical protein [Myxococcota bacterium]